VHVKATLDFCPKLANATNMYDSFFSYRVQNYSIFSQLTNNLPLFFRFSCHFPAFYDKYQHFAIQNSTIRPFLQIEKPRRDRTSSAISQVDWDAHVSDRTD